MEEEIAFISENGALVYENNYVKFALSVPIEKTQSIQVALQQYFRGKITAVSSGHGSIDIIIPDKDKADGLKHLINK